MLRRIFGLQEKAEKLKLKFHEEIHEHNQISSRNSHYNIVLWLRKLKSYICVADIFQARVCKEAWKGRTGSAPRVNLQPFVCRSSFPLCVKKLKLQTTYRFGGIVDAYYIRTTLSQLEIRVSKCASI